MSDGLRGFDPKAIYDDASREYEEASRDFWQYLSARTVERLELQPGERVLDVPCGTGAALLAAAPRVGPTGRVVGIDYAEQMLAIAGEKVRARGLGNVELLPGDMTALRPPAVRYDAVVCVLGIFFVEDMAGLVRSLLDLVRPDGGRVAVSVFGERFCDPVREIFVRTVGEVAPDVEVVQPWCRTEDVAVLRRILNDAGAGDVAIETDDDALPLRDGDHWWSIVMGSGLRRTVLALGSDRAALVRARCEAELRAGGVEEVVTRSRYAVVRRD